VDALITAKAKKSKDNENIIIKIIKDEKHQDTQLMDTIKTLANNWKNIKSEKETSDNNKAQKSLDSIIKQAIED